MNVSPRAQFEAERQLAKMIYSASPHERPGAYYRAYKELYEKFPEIATNEAEEANRSLTTAAFLASFVARSELIVEVGAGRCHLVQHLAKSVARVIAIDVTVLADTAAWPDNLEHLVFDGLHIDVPDRVVDLAISDNVIEHLHPDDALPQLREIRRILKPDGHIAVLTPNKVNGPHDISADFSKTPEGLHLKEYSCLEMNDLLVKAGYRRVRAYVGFGGRYIALYPQIGALIEAVMSVFPRQFLRKNYIRWLLPNRFTAQKIA